MICMFVWRDHVIFPVFCVQTSEVGIRRKRDMDEEKERER